MGSIQLKKVEKFYGKEKVVHGIDLAIARNEFLVLVGPSGCGKSTTLRMIAGLEEISGGEILIDGELINDLPPRKRNVSMVFQNYALYPHMSVRENLGFALKIAGKPGDVIARDVNEAADILGLSDLMERTPAELSGGQRQRVAMGRAIVRQPVAFLFDEPLSNLDAKLRVQMRTEIKKLHQRLKTTVVYVTHDQVEAMTLADRIVVMKDGYIEQVGTPLEVFTRPVNTFVAGFIGSPPMNQIPGKIKSGKVVLSDNTAIPVSAKFKNKLRNGQDVILGIRPEDMSPVGHGIDDSGAGAKIDLRVDIAEHLGTETLLYMQLGGREVQGKMFDPRDVAPGEKLKFRIAIDKTHLFDAANGKSLRAD